MSKSSYANVKLRRLPPKNCSKKWKKDMMMKGLIREDVTIVSVCASSAIASGYLKQVIMDSKKGTSSSTVIMGNATSTLS